MHDLMFGLRSNTQLILTDTAYATSTSPAKRDSNNYTQRVANIH